MKQKLLMDRKLMGLDTVRRHNTMYFHFPSFCVYLLRIVSFRLRGSRHAE